MSNINENYKEWGKLLTIGDKYYYPSSPSKEELKIVEGYFMQIIKKISQDTKNKKNNELKNKPTLNVIVLGATPGLRDMVIKLKQNLIKLNLLKQNLTSSRSNLASINLTLTSIDLNLDCFIAMNKLMDFKSKDEVIIRGNWLTVPLKENNYDVVLGDLSFNNVAFNEHEALFKKLNSLLKPNGYLLIRNIVNIPDLERMSIKQIINDYRNDKIKWRDFKYLIRFLLPESWNRWYNSKTKESFWSLYFEYIKKAYEHGILTKDEFESIYREKTELVSTMPEKKEFESIMKLYFDIIECVYCKAYQYSIYAPIYLAKVRKEGN